MAKKGGKGKKGKKAAASDSGAPQIVQMKGGLAAGALVKEVVFTMEDDLRISNKQARDFTESLVAVVTREIEAGKPVNLFGLVKIVPRLHTKGEREVNSEFGNPDSPKVKKKYPAKITFKTGQAIFLRPLKEAAPTVQKLQRRIASNFED